MSKLHIIMVSKYGVLFFVIAVASAAAKSSNGEGCIFKTSQEFGVCTDFMDCTTAKGESCRGTPPQACPSYDEDGSVCCKSVECPPLPTGLVKIPVTGYKAWDYCRSITELAYPCEFMGDSTTRIDACPQLPDRNVTGDATVVSVGEYPHLVLLGSSTNVENNIWTSAHLGTLISDRWVLASALTATSRTYAKVGGLAQGGTVYAITRFIRHPRYQEPTGLSTYNNIALLELEKSVTFSKLVLPACLHTGSELPEERLKNIVGTLGFWSRDVEILSHEECSSLYNEYTVILPNGVNETTQFCVRRTTGDSIESIYGAPIQLYNGASSACTQIVMGIFDNRVNPEHLTTRVAPYISWIESIVWP